MMRPFLARHIALVDPGVIVVMGNAPLQAVLNTTGILRARGQWGQAFGKPVLPMVHPSHLLRMPAAKAEAWADLLALQAKLRG
jgi:DNA polymerase